MLANSEIDPFEATLVDRATSPIGQVDSIEMELVRIKRSVDMINMAIRGMNQKLEDHSTSLEKLHIQQELYHSLGKWILNNAFPIISAAGSLILLVAKFLH